MPKSPGNFLRGLERQENRWSSSDNMHGWRQAGRKVLEGRSEEVDKYSSKPMPF